MVLSSIPAIESDIFFENSEVTILINTIAVVDISKQKVNK
jgi:hypothetical protein